MNQKFDLNIYYDVEEVKQETINEILEEHKNEFDELKKKYKTGEYEIEKYKKLLVYAAIKKYDIIEEEYKIEIETCDSSIFSHRLADNTYFCDYLRMGEYGIAALLNTDFKRLDIIYPFVYEEIKEEFIVELILEKDCSLLYKKLKKVTKKEFSIISNCVFNQGNILKKIKNLYDDEELNNIIHELYNNHYPVISKYVLQDSAIFEDLYKKTPIFSLNYNNEITEDFEKITLDLNFTY